MSEKVDLQKTYIELDETIKKGDHTQCLNLSNKILSAYPNEKEALKSKIISLIFLKKFMYLSIISSHILLNSSIFFVTLKIISLIYLKKSDELI